MKNCSKLVTGTAVAVFMLVSSMAGSAMANGIAICSQSKNISGDNFNACLNKASLRTNAIGSVRARAPKHGCITVRNPRELAKITRANAIKQLVVQHKQPKYHQLWYY